MSGSGRRLAGAAFLAQLAACATGIPEGALRLPPEAAADREAQTRRYEGITERALLAAGASALQDLGFVLDAADATLGTVTATKLAHYRIRMTVSVRPVDTQQILVRANADYSEPLYGASAVRIEDPATYQDFFQALERPAFLAAQRAE